LSRKNSAGRFAYQVEYAQDADYRGESRHGFRCQHRSSDDDHAALRHHQSKQRGEENETGQPLTEGDSGTAALEPSSNQKTAGQSGGSEKDEKAAQDKIHAAQRWSGPG